MVIGVCAVKGMRCWAMSVVILDKSLNYEEEIHYSHSRVEDHV
jgi:hypothetical protein